MGWLRRIFQRDQSLGERGERLAERLLRRSGYRILERNLHVHAAEVDLLALDPDGVTVVIVEVKTRTDDERAPEESVNARKQQHLVRLAMTLQQQPRFRDRAFRFDAIAVVIPPAGEPVLRHIPGAFSSR